MPIDLNTLSVIVFVAILAAILLRDRKKVKRESIVFFRRTQRGRAFLTSMGESHTVFWKAVGNVAIVAGFAGSFITLAALVFTALKSLQSTAATPGVALVLPTIGTSAYVGTGFIGAPFWFWMISISLLMFVHEGLHGIMASREGVKIKSLGLVLLAVFPGAFVEPDEKQMKRKSLMAQLRIFASGSFANFVVAGVASLLILLFSGIFPVPLVGNFVVNSGGMLYNVTPGGVGVAGLEPGFAAANANFTGMIVAANGMPVKALDDLFNITGKVKPGDKFTFTALQSDNSLKSFTLTARPSPGNSTRGLFGFRQLYTMPSYKAKGQYQLLAPLISFLMGTFPFATIHEGGLLFWIFLVNLGVGMFNMLPIRALDGGLMWQALIEKASRKHAVRVINAISVFIILVLAVTFMGAFGLFRL